MTTKFAPKHYFQSETEKSENHQWILDIQISRDTKFRLKQTILIFWTNFAKKRYVCFKTETVNITMEFGIFELVYNRFLNILRLFDVLQNYPLTSSETMGGCYL